MGNMNLQFGFKRWSNVWETYIDSIRDIEMGRLGIVVDFYPRIQSHACPPSCKG